MNQASSVCWKQNTDCFNSAGPTGSKNCYIWKAKCKGIEEACNAGNFIGPPDAGKDLTPTLASLVLPAPESTSGVSSYFSESTYSAQTSIASVHPSISSISSSASWIMTVSSSSLHSSMPSSLVNTATLLSSDKTLIPAQPSSSSVPVPNLNITAFFRRDCVVPINGNNSVLVPKGRCSAFGNNTSPNDPIANPIPNGYVSCCYYFGGSFSSVHVLNPDPEAFSSCSLTKFNGYDCDYGGNPETAGTLDIADTCLNTFYNTGAEGAPSNNEPAFAFRVDCIVGNSSSSSAPTPQVKTQSSSSNISSSATLTNLSSKGQDNSHTVPTECHASARPSDTARSLDRPRLVTYVSELEPISETITTVVTFRDYDNLYAPSQYFTVTGPTTIYATITAELKPDRAALANPYKTQASDYCQGICGACSLYFPSVDVLYWPVTSMNTACLGNRTTVTQQASLPSNRVRVREHSLVGAGNSHLVSDGFTLYSSSLHIWKHGMLTT